MKPTKKRRSGIDPFFLIIGGALGNVIDRGQPRGRL